MKPKYPFARKLVYDFEPITPPKEEEQKAVSADFDANVQEFDAMFTARPLEPIQEDDQSG